VSTRGRYLIFASLAGAIVLGALQLWQSATTPSVGSLRRAIKRELPLGSTHAQTIAFLHAHGLDARNISAPVSNKYNFDPFVAQYRDGTMIYASIPELSRGFLTTAGIYMRFVFDRTGRLRDYDVNVVLTGL
jgi:hypothetical protein